MMATEITTLQDFSLEAITEAFNDAFSDYFIEVDMSPEEMAYKIAAENIDLSISPAVVINGRIMGLILHGSRILEGMLTAYNAGTGVRPEARRQGHVKSMYAFILPLLAQKGNRRSILEVIDINAPALLAYLGLGFRQTRYLESFVGKVKSTELLHSFAICKLDSWEEIAQLNAWWDYSPTWQHQLQTAIQTWDRQDAFGVFDGEKICGYCLFSPFSGRVLQFAIAPSYRKRGLGRWMFGHMQQRSASPLRCVNVEQIPNGPGDFLYRLGFKKMLGQWEMQLPIS